MTYRQWWLKNLAAVGMPAIITFPIMLLSRSETGGEDALIVLLVFYFCLGIGLYGLHNTTNQSSHFKTVLLRILYGVFALVISILSVVLGIVLAYIYTFFMIGLYVFVPAFENYLTFVNEFFYFDAAWYFVISLTLITSFFSGGLSGTLLALLGRWVLNIERPDWVLKMCQAGACAGVSMSLGLLYWAATDSGMKYELSIGLQTVLGLLVSIFVILLMSTSISYFTYDRRLTGSRQIALGSDLER